MTTPKNAPAVPPLTLKLPEAARALGISARTLWDLAHKGKIPVVRMGGLRRFDPADLAEFVKRSKHTANPASAKAAAAVTN